MKFTTAQDFTSLAELLRLYGDADEIVFKSHCRLDGAEIAEACHGADTGNGQAHACHESAESEWTKDQCVANKAMCEAACHVVSADGGAKK